MTVETLEDNVRQLIGNKSEKRDIIKVLSKAGYKIEDSSEEYGCMNLRIYIGKEYVRIFRHRRHGIVIQAWKLMPYAWSGIPTFEPSGRKSF